MVLLCQLENQLAGHDQRLLVGQGNGLAGLDGVDGGREPGKADHRREHHVDGTCLDNLVEGLRTGIDLHVGQVVHQPPQLVVARLVGNDHGGRLELMGLPGQQFHLIVSCQAVDLVEVTMLADDLERLGAYRPRGAENGYLAFLLHNAFSLIRAQKY